MARRREAGVTALIACSRGVGGFAESAPLRRIPGSGFTLAASPMQT